MENKEKEPSVCRTFYEKFSPGKPRVHQELVSFLMQHPSSRSKLEEWIVTAEQNRQPTGELPFKSNLHDYDDITSANESSAPAGPIPPMMLNSDNTTLTKCDVKSKTERELGNEYFRKKKLETSLRHYNQAIKYAPHSKIKDETDNLTNEISENDQSCLSMALANRSAVYYDIGESFYSQSLKDIELALKYGYPERLKPKLLLRQASIFAKQGFRAAAQQCLENIKTHQASFKRPDEQNTVHTKPCNGTSHFPTATIQSIDAKIDAIELQIKRLPHTAVSKEKDSVANVDASVDFCENSNFVSASENISLRTSVPLGRHVVASTNLHEGEVLFKELPYASVLLPPFYESHCHHCHKALVQMQYLEPYFFPCSRCTQVLFCDDLCAANAEHYHIHECGWLDLLHSVGIAHLAVRIVLSAGVEKVVKCAINHTNVSDLKNVEIFKRDMDNYQRVYSLIDHINDMFEEDLFQYTLTASLLTEFLISKTSFLPSYSREEQLQVGGGLLRHICQLVCNAHAVTDILPDDLSTSSLVIDEYQKRIATAIYSSASMMNHSCDSNIIFHFMEGKELIVKAARKIKKNGNVYNCYGPHFRRMPLTERQEILKQQYMFSCDCDKCCEEYQSGISFASQFQALQCKNCKEPVQQAGPIARNEAEIVSCLGCGKKYNMDEKLVLLNAVCNLHERGEYLLDQGRILEATETLSSCYASASQLLFKYNSQFGKICDSLARCYVSTGKLKDAKLLLEQSLAYVEKRFGKNSAEYTKESQKYQDVNAKC